MQKFYSSNGESTIATGNRYEISELKHLLYEKQLSSWQIIYKDPSDNSSRRIEAFSSDNSKIITYSKYRELIKNRNKYDFIYDSLSERFYSQEGPKSVPAGAWHNGSPIIRLLAVSRLRHFARDIVDELDIRGKDPDASVRQAIERLNNNFLSLIINIRSQGYILNPQIKWLVLIEQV